MTSGGGLAPLLADGNRIPSLVDANSPDAARLIQWPRALHELEQYPFPQAACNDEGGTFDDALIELVARSQRKQAALSSS